MTQKITPFLWFDGTLEEAMLFYTSVFKNSKIITVNRATAGMPAPAGSVFSATFELEGQRFYGLNGGPMFKVTPAISFFVDCKTQEEVDTLWQQLSAGGEEQMCGWLKDKYGISWQIIPTILGELLYAEDKAAAGRAMQAMMKMRKIDIDALQQAYNAK